jgi:hypothetical protein
MASSVKSLAIFYKISVAFYVALRFGDHGFAMTAFCYYYASLRQLFLEMDFVVSCHLPLSSLAWHLSPSSNQRAHRTASIAIWAS